MLFAGISDAFFLLLESHGFNRGRMSNFDGCKVAIYSRPWNVKAELPNENFVRCADWKEIDEVFRQGCTSRPLVFWHSRNIHLTEQIAKQEKYC